MDLERPCRVSRRQCSFSSLFQVGELPQYPYVYHIMYCLRKDSICTHSMWSLVHCVDPFLKVCCYTRAVSDLCQYTEMRGLGSTNEVCSSLRRRRSIYSRWNWMPFPDIYIYHYLRCLFQDESIFFKINSSLTYTRLSTILKIFLFFNSWVMNFPEIWRTL